MTEHTKRYKRRLKIEGSKSSALDVARGRFALVCVFFVLSYVIVMARVFDLSIIEGHLAGFEYNHVPIAQIETSEQFSGLRGDIYDRNAVLLATSLKAASLYADPSLIRDPDQAANALVGVFPELKYGDVLQRLQRSGRFVWLKRNITPQEQKSILRLGIPGLAFREEQTRIYPHGNLTSHIVGTTNIDGRGVSGIEAGFDNFLSPSVSEKTQDLTLTLDVRLQHALRREMQKATQEYNAKAGAGLVFDITNGEILASVSLPDFDPHHPTLFKDKPENPLFNRVTLGVYELGSTFKIFSTAAYLDHFDVDLSHKFDATKPIQRGRFKISDFHAEERILTLPEVFMYSSNIGSALMAEELGTENLKNFYADLGLLNRTQLEIPEVGSPLIPKPWRDINTITASYGHGIAVTPLQLMVASASIINGGVRVNPTLIRYHDKVHKTDIDTPQNSFKNRYDIRVVTQKTAHRIRQLLRLVVTDGTASRADVKGISVGGKTGTAEKIGPSGYDKKRLISSFIGFFPIENPKYGVLVAIDEPKGTKKSFGYATGGWVAAPAVKEVISAMAVILGMPSEHKDSVEDIAYPLKMYISDKDDKGSAE